MGKLPTTACLFFFALKKKIMPSSIVVKVKWGKERLDVPCDPEQTGAVFKTQLQKLTNVPCDRQKLICPKNASVSTAKRLKDTLLNKINVEVDFVMLVGTAEEAFVPESMKERPREAAKSAAVFQPDTSIPFAKAVDEQILAALRHKGELVRGPTSDQLALALSVLERFLDHLGQLLDAYAVNPSSVASRIENTLIGPLQCELIDGSTNTSLRKQTNTIFHNTIDRLSDGTIILTQHTMVQQLREHEWSVGTLRDMLWRGCPLPSIRKKLWESTIVPYLKKFVPQGYRIGAAESAFDYSEEDVVQLAAMTPLPLSFIQSVDTELQEALAHKAALLGSRKGTTTTGLDIATKVLERFLHRVGRHLDIQENILDAARQDFPKVASRVEEVLLTPLQSELIDTSTDKEPRKEANQTVQNIMVGLARGTLILSKRHLEATLAEAGPVTLSLEEVLSRVPFPSLRIEFAPLPKWTP